MSEQIKVTPGKLQTTASQFENEGEQVAATTGAMINIATALSGAWQGAASSAYIAKLRGMEGNIQRLVKMIREHSSDLKQMAQNYERAEAQNAEAASAIRQSEVH
uniref:WXG100 family type VII secretion target n=1 Tax=Eubacterium cellulosolvens TaxID=29322 RepID=UPI0004832F98|nr:WXG100 family type VII secretion target [[Eubacterium] cellulosolvens]